MPGRLIPALTSPDAPRPAAENRFRSRWDERPAHALAVQPLAATHSPNAGFLLARIAVEVRRRNRAYARAWLALYEAGVILMGLEESRRLRRFEAVRLEERDSLIPASIVVDNQMTAYWRQESEVIPRLLRQLAQLGVTEPRRTRLSAVAVDLLSDLYDEVAGRWAKVMEW
jgi:hypothetical protein